MGNDPEVTEAIKKAFEELSALSDEEFKALMEKHSDGFWGNSIWYGLDPEGYLKHCEERDNGKTT